MHYARLRHYLNGTAAIMGLVLIGLAGCNTFGLRSDETASCQMPAGHNLDAAFAETRTALSSGCEWRFDDYMTRLLEIAEGDPGPHNKRHFSEFLLWASGEGLISKRQAQSLYNRYFNVKFVSLRGDYNNCSHTCPNRHSLLADMEQELSDKELGLLKVSGDSDGYYRADQLLKEAELVLEATCTACGTAY